MEELGTNENTEEQFKSPIISIFGHVDAGKTSLVDSIRNSRNVDEEAGGITQSIGSYFIDANDISEFSNSIKNKFKIDNLVPGFLIIDTPGHSAFTAIRQQGSTLCNIAILIVDIIKGVQDQTKECVEILKNNKIPFIIAASKIDLINDWVKTDEVNFKKALNKQTEEVKLDFSSKIEDLKYDLENLDIKSEFYLNNEKPKLIANIVPVSSHSKEGLSDLLNLLIFISQKFMKDKIKFDKWTFDATIMDSGLDRAGYYVDIILGNGELDKTNSLVIHTNTGVKSSVIRSIQKQEIVKFGDRSKIDFVSVDSAKASCGLRIHGVDLAGAISGSKIYRSHMDDLDGIDLIERAESEMREFWQKYRSKFSDEGIYLIVPTIGEFDAVFTHLINEKVPISGGEVGLLKKLCITKYSTTITSNEYKENKIILYFNSKSQKLDDTEIKNALTQSSIELISSEILYDLSNKYDTRKNEIIEERKKEYVSSGKVVFPCCLHIIEDKIFKRGGNQNFVFGIKVLNGTLHKGTPVFAQNGKEVISLGKVKSIISHKGKVEKQLDIAEKGLVVCIQIENEHNKSLGRHFDHNDKLFSEINRGVIEILKKDYRHFLQDKQVFKLIKEIKEIQNIK